MSTWKSEVKIFSDIWDRIFSEISWYSCSAFFNNKSLMSIKGVEFSSKERKEYKKFILENDEFFRRRALKSAALDVFLWVPPKRINFVELQLDLLPLQKSVPSLD